MSFVINVHDTGHIDESADTVIRAAQRFDAHGVRGDFYISAPMADAYAASRPDVIRAMATQTLSYHVRAPHPMVPGFGPDFSAMDDVALAAALLDMERYAQDPATGELIRTRSGGYSRVAEVFGRAPVTVGMPNPDGRVRAAASRMFRSFGAKVVAWAHQSPAVLDPPWEWHEGLLARTNDVSVSHFGPHDDFWWNRIGQQGDYDFDPSRYMDEQLAKWSASRQPFVTSLIHENNFPRSGAESWTLRYYSDAKSKRPLPPPWNLAARDPSTLRPQSEQDTIWLAYERLIANAVTRCQVITSEDLPGLAGA